MVQVAAKVQIFLGAYLTRVARFLDVRADGLLHEHMLPASRHCMDGSMCRDPLS
jgi:hypothetical protein